MERFMVVRTRLVGAIGGTAVAGAGARRALVARATGQAECEQRADERRERNFLHWIPSY